MPVTASSMKYRYTCMPRRVAVRASSTAWLNFACAGGHETRMPNFFTSDGVGIGEDAPDEFEQVFGLVGLAHEPIDLDRRIKD